MRNVGLRVVLVGGGIAFGCGSGDAPIVGSLSADGGTPLCSQMHRALYEWQGKDDCGPDVTGLLELTPIGNHQILGRRRFSWPDRLWYVSDTGEIAGPVLVNEMADGELTDAFAYLPGPSPRVLVYDPGKVEWNLYSDSSPLLPYTPVLTAPQPGEWLPESFHAGMKGPAGHQLIGLPDGHLLDRDLGDGSTRIWLITQTGMGTADIKTVAGLVGGPRPEFRRGHRIVPIGPGRLLEWLPHACDASAAPDGVCLGADYRVWRYALDAGGAARDPIEPAPESTGTWKNLGPGNDIVADDTNLFVWTRRDGLLRSYPLDPTVIDADQRFSMGDRMDPTLQSQEWAPPTTAPKIKHLVVILQDGRSFDSYFGRYCKFQPAGPGDAPTCDSGPDCCEAMPASVPGAAACAPIGSDVASEADGRAPNPKPECMKEKIADGKMTGFAVPSLGGTCGSPLDFACAGPDEAPGTPADYWRLLPDGALADRFFQTYAYAYAADGSLLTVSADVENLIYLTTVRFGDQSAFGDTPVLEKELARVQVPWAIYAGPHSLPLAAAFGVPQFYDPDWYPFRALGAGELDSDIDVGALPSVAVVLPDVGDMANSEAPGRSPRAGIAFVKNLIAKIAASPFYGQSRLDGGNTLVLLTYLTAGGYYDQVKPPAALDLTVDGSSSLKDQAGKVYYGPRVPLLALPPFARKGHIAHEPLEMSSIALFIEWNWLHNNRLKGAREQNDPRAYRDTVVNNIGGLIDPDAAGAPVPVGQH